MNKTNQIKQYMRQGNTLTSWEAIQMFRYTRLSDLIFKWKRTAEIKSVLIVKGKEHWSEYTLIREDIQKNPYKSKLILK